jgi:hypothetical protein
VSSPQELAVLAVLSVIVVALLESVIRRTPVGVYLLLGTIGLIVVFTDRASFNIWIGGTRISFVDVVGAVLLAAAVARMARSGPLSELQWLFVGFFGICTLSVVMGAAEHGANAALNEFRRYFYFSSAALYFSTVRPTGELLAWVARVWMVFAGALLVLAIVRWAVLPFDLTGWAQPADGKRVIGSDPTLVMLQAFALGLLAWARGEAPVWMRRLTPALLAAVILMQHRTVWVALVLVLAVATLLEPKVFRRFVPIILIGTAVIGALNATVLQDDDVTVTAELAESAGFRGTWEWRIDGWQALLEQSGPRDEVEVLVGRPFGGGWQRVMPDGGIVTASPHNYYVETFLRTGVAGLGFVAILYVNLMRRLARRSHFAVLDGRFLLVVLVSHVVYFVAYTPGPEQGMLIGLAVAAASTRPSEVPAHGAPPHFAADADVESTGTPR